MRADWLILAALLALPVAAAETILYEDFQDGSSDGWRAFGEGTLQITNYQGNASLRMTKDAMAARAIPISGMSSVRIGASFAAMGLEDDKACIGEATIDDGETWFEVIRVVDGQDNSITLHTGAVTRDVPATTTRIWFRGRVAGTENDDICWLDNVYVVAGKAASHSEVAGKAASYRRKLTRSLLLQGSQLASPVAMREYAMPEEATQAANTFSGTLRLIGTDDAGGFRVVSDDWDRVADIGEPIRHLPEFDFEFVQRGHDLLPLQRGVIRREHPYWEIILQPGRVWDEDGDGGLSRASLPFSLQERAANCTHNGIMTWLFDDAGTVSRIAYQISSETCGYLKIDMWGLVEAEYDKYDLSEAATPHFLRLDSHRQSRLPVKPIERIAEDHPGVDPLSFGIDDGIHPDDMTVFGIVVDGVHYHSDCFTREGPYPFCDSLPVPSYSTAKSIFAAVAMMRLEKLHADVSQASIASLIDECDSEEWRDVTVENALDMATGNFMSAEFDADENRDARHVEFIFSDSHEDKIEFACTHFERKAPPGTQFIYHTSDTYLVGTALQNFVAAESIGSDLYNDVLVESFWRRLDLSPLLDSTKRTYDAAAQAFTGYGLTYEVDDVIRVAAWLHNEDAEIDGEPMLDRQMLDAGLQRNPDDRGLPVGLPYVIYNNSFWGFEAGQSLGCSESVWVPYMAGVSGINVVMFPNDIIYYYFSDGYVFRWQSAREAAHTIRSLCE